VSAATFTEHELAPAQAPHEHKFNGAGGCIGCSKPWDICIGEMADASIAAVKAERKLFRTVIETSVHVDADVAQALKAWADQISFQYAGRPGAKVADDMRALVVRMEASLKERRKALEDSAR
jgi:hypothetical protein